MTILDTAASHRSSVPLPATPRRPWAALALLLLVPAPALGVIVAMMLPETRGTTLGQIVYGLSKVWILILPTLWTLWIERRRITFPRPRSAEGLFAGALLGIAIGAVVMATYFNFGRDLIDVEQMRAAAHVNGIGTPARYLALVLGLALINSLLEEYVWRWFVFRQCERLTGGGIAVILSALCFTLHHFLALIAQTTMSVALLGSLGVFIGGCAWSWCFLRYRSIWPGWVSHVIVDAAVFGVGWVILFGT